MVEEFLWKKYSIFIQNFSTIYNLTVKEKFVMEQRKHQFLGFIVILLVIGFLNYFRRIINGHKFTKYGKILYLATMITFVVGIMFVLYFTELNNIVSFLIGLFVATLSEHIAKMFVSLGDNFNPIAVKILKKFTGVDLKDELCDCDKKDENVNK